MVCVPMEQICMRTIKIIIEMALLVLAHENCLHSAEFTCDGG